MKRILHLFVMTVIVFSITFTFVWTLNQVPAFAVTEQQEQIRPIELAQIEPQPITEHWTVPAHNALFLYDTPDNIAGMKNVTGDGVECGFKDDNENVFQLDNTEYTLLPPGRITVKCFYDHTRVQGQVETLSSESLIEVNEFAPYLDQGQGQEPAP